MTETIESLEKRVTNLTEIVGAAARSIELIAAQMSVISDSQAQAHYDVEYISQELDSNVEWMIDLCRQHGE